MSVKIRLRRMGKKKQPHYRIVVTDSRAPRDGRFVENLGYYNPVPEPAALSVDLSRVDYWLGEGAIVSPTVRSLVSKARAGGDGKVALAGAASAADADAEPGAASGNGAAGDALGAAAEEASAEQPAAAEAAAGDAPADEAPAPAAGDAPAPETPEAATEVGAEAGAAGEAPGTPEAGDDADPGTPPESGAA